MTASRKRQASARQAGLSILSASKPGLAPGDRCTWRARPQPAALVPRRLFRPPIGSLRESSPSQRGLAVMSGPTEVPEHVPCLMRAGDKTERATKQEMGIHIKAVALNFHQVSMMGRLPSYFRRLPLFLRHCIDSEWDECEGAAKLMSSIEILVMCFVECCNVHLTFLPRQPVKCPVYFGAQNNLVLQSKLVGLSCGNTPDRGEQLMGL